MQFSSSNLSFIDISWLNLLLLLWLTNGGFLIPSSFLHSLLPCHFIKKLSSLPIYLHQFRCMDSYFIQWVIISNCPYCGPVRAPSDGPLSPFVLSLLFFEYFLITFWHTRYIGSRFILYLSCPRLAASCFSRKPWFLLVENGILVKKSI